MREKKQQGGLGEKERLPTHEEARFRGSAQDTGGDGPYRRKTWVAFDSRKHPQGGQGEHRATAGHSGGSGHVNTNRGGRADGLIREREEDP